jgi:phospholipase C
MLDHVSLGVTDLERSRRFYDAALRPLGLVRILDFEGRGSDYGAMPGQLGVEFTITAELSAGSPAPGMHFCFRAHDREAVRAFHAAALRAGGHAGVTHPTTELSPDYQGCRRADPDHSWSGGRIDFADGAMDGFLLNTNCAAPYCPRQTNNDTFAIGYYGKEVRPFFNSLALAYTTFDRFFSSILSETYPNRIFMHAAQTDRLTNTLELSTLPTIWDRLAAKGVSARYYYSDVSFLWLWGTKYASISASYDQFLKDAHTGHLPRVAFVEPRFLGAEQGVSNDDHPFADVRSGDAFLAETFRAVSTGPQWGNTVFIVTYDEWGGFFEHVPPPRADAPNDVDPDIVDGKARLGMRVPVVVASPFTTGDPADPRVNSTVYDNTSILKLIESRWGLAPLTARDASSDVGNLADALDFSQPVRRLPSLPTVVAPPPAVCPTNSSNAAVDHEIGMEDLVLLAPRN